MTTLEQGWNPHDITEIIPTREVFQDNEPQPEVWEPETSCVMTARDLMDRTGYDKLRNNRQLDIAGAVETIFDRLFVGHDQRIIETQDETLAKLNTALSTCGLQVTYPSSDEPLSIGNIALHFSFQYRNSSDIPEDERERKIAYEEFAHIFKTEEIQAEKQNVA